MKYTKLINEVVYGNNIGFHELTTFYRVAPRSIIGQFEQYLKKDMILKAMDLLELTIRKVLNKSKMELN